MNSDEKYVSVQYPDGNLGCGTSGQSLGCLWAALNGSPWGPGGEGPPHGDGDHEGVGV